MIRGRRRAALALVALVALVALGGCAAAGKAALGVVAGGGPNVAANVQAGRTNTQTLGQTSNSDQRLQLRDAQRVEQSSGPQTLRADRVERVVVNEVPPWVVLVALAGWMLPTPAQIGHWIAGGLSAAWRRARAVKGR